MKINFNINITNKIMYLTLFMLTAVLVSIFATAYNTQQPSMFGHTAGEIAAGIFGGDERSSSDVWSFAKGKIGIGTTNPVGLLDVNGLTIIRGNLETTGSYVSAKKYCLNGISDCVTSWEQMPWPQGAHCGVSARGKEGEYKLPCLGFDPFVSCPSGFQRVELRYLECDGNCHYYSCVKK